MSKSLMVAAGMSVVATALLFELFAQAGAYFDAKNAEPHRLSHATHRTRGGQLMLDARTLSQLRVTTAVNLKRASIPSREIAGNSDRLH